MSNFLILRIVELLAHQVCKFLKKQANFYFDIFYYFWMFVNKLFTYLKFAYLRK